MNFIGKLMGKFFRYLMLLGLFLLGLNSVDAFLQGQGSLLELFARLAMLYLVYKFLVPLGERFLVFFAGANLTPQQRQAPRRQGGVVERFPDSTGKAVGDWLLGSNAPKPSPGPTPWEIQNKRAWNRHQAEKREAFCTYQANWYQGTYDGYVASNRAKQAREDAKHS